MIFLLALACTAPVEQLTVDPPSIEHAVEIACPSSRCFTGTVTLTAHEDGHIVVPYPTTEEAIAQTGTGVRIGALEHPDGPEGQWFVMAGDTVEADYIACVQCATEQGAYPPDPGAYPGHPSWALHWSDDGRGGHACLFEATVEVWVVVE